MNILVLNAGSSSVKYQLFDLDDETVLAAGLVERIGTPASQLIHRWRPRPQSPHEPALAVSAPRLAPPELLADHPATIPDGARMGPTSFPVRGQIRTEPGGSQETVLAHAVADHETALAVIASALRASGSIETAGGLEGIGHRVVHGGELFREPAVINPEVLRGIREMVPLAPLHNPPNLATIEGCLRRFPQTPQVAVFDTAFHQTMPPEAFRYAVPEEFYALHHVRRYGFHGTSHRFVAQAAADHLGRSLRSINLITLHLGNGASAAAIQHGQCVDTSMGLTPLEGLIMGTRCGDLDPAVVFHLLRTTGMAPEELEAQLNQQSGLKGLCGTNDMREIIEQNQAGDARAELAVAMFCYRIKKYIGAYVAVLGGLDALVFTGGIGERAPLIRELACRGLEILGLAVDPAKNGGAAAGVAEIQTDRSRVKVLVIPTNEELEIARQTAQALRASQLTANGEP